MKPIMLLPLLLLACTPAQKKEGQDVQQGTLSIARYSVITCPKCGTSRKELLPTEVCQLAYTCTVCDTVLHPKGEDCCVFCTYGDQKCPSMQ